MIKEWLFAEEVLRKGALSNLLPDRAREVCWALAALSGDWPHANPPLACWAQRTGYVNRGRSLLALFALLLAAPCLC